MLKSKTSAAGRAATFTYDANGNLKTVKDGRGYGPTYSYNADGTLATATDARGNATQYQTYDHNGYPTKIIDPAHAETDFQYDLRGNVMQVEDSLGRITRAEYDVFGRPKAVTTPYDGAQTRTTATEYDLNDNVTKVTAPARSHRRRCDAADNVVTKSLPDNNMTGRQLAYSYDALGRPGWPTARLQAYASHYAKRRMVYRCFSMIRLATRRSSESGSSLAMGSISATSVGCHLLPTIRTAS